MVNALLSTLLMGSSLLFATPTVLVNSEPRWSLDYQRAQVAQSVLSLLFTQHTAHGHMAHSSHSLPCTLIIPQGEGAATAGVVGNSEHSNMDLKKPDRDTLSCMEMLPPWQTHNQQPQ